MLFYRYMLPCVTTEVYSWADPENDDSGFKTGVENGLSRPWQPLPAIGNTMSHGLMVMSNNENILE